MLDDVILADMNEKRFQRMLDITERTTSKYHIEYGAPKCNVMNISGKEMKPNFILGTMEFKYTDIDKYLGFLQNTKNMKTHLHTLKGNTDTGASRKHNI